MLSENIINSILVDMMTDLNMEQISKLKNSLINHTYDVDVVSKSTELSTESHDNYYYIRMFEEVMIVENKSEKTIYQYIRATKQFLEWLNKDFKYVKYEDAMVYLESIVKSGVSGSTVDNTRKFVKAFFTRCNDNDYITKNPFAKIKRVARNPLKKETLDEDDIVELRDRCHGNKRDLALVDLLLATGIRVSECARLDISDVDFRNGQVSVYGKKTKTWRTVYLDANARKHLKEYVDSRTDKNKALFVGRYKNPCRLSGGAINTLLHKLEHNCKLTVHVFRKNSCH